MVTGIFKPPLKGDFVGILFCRAFPPYIGKIDTLFVSPRLSYTFLGPCLSTGRAQEPRRM